MKKFAAILFVIAIIASLAMSAFAATGLNEHEKAVLDKLGSSKVIGKNGWSFTVPEKYLNSAENYFAGDCDMTAEEKTVILSYIDQGMAIVKKEADAQNFQGKEYNLAMMGDADKAEVLKLGQVACEQVELTLTYNAKGQEVVITPVNSSTPVFESSPVVKTTGQDFPVTAATVGITLAVVLVLGTAVMFTVSKKNDLLVK